MRIHLCLLAAVCAAGDLFAQSNSRGAGYDGALSNISSARAWGRRGLGYPNGEVGVSFQNELCNPGSMTISWLAPMAEDHPKFGFLVAKDQGGRFLQISDWSHCKHAFLSLNDPGPCGTCANTASAQQMYVGCSDVYSNSNNGDRRYLGPPNEIDPWLGTWEHIGSYFDRGDPDVGLPANLDGVRSLTSSTGWDPVKNRVTIRESDLAGVTSNLFFQIHVVMEGEPVTNRANNTMSRPFTLTWNGASWTAGTTGTATHGSILTRWTGSSLAIGGNGNDDGRFAVAVKVTGPMNGKWHYEYVVQNLDNSRGAASFRVPVCPQASVTGLGFRDIDQNPLNEWLPTVSGGEIVWAAPASHALEWNRLYNFWFDCDAAPTTGTTLLDEARLGPGAPAVTVASQVPGTLRAWSLGAGCGAPAATAFANSDPVSPNPAFGIGLTAAPSTPLFAFFSFGSASVPVAPGCTQYLATASLVTHGLLFTDGAGNASIPLPIPPGLAPTDVFFQAAAVQPGGPVLGEFVLTNGLALRVGGVGCPQ